MRLFAKAIRWVIGVSLVAGSAVFAGVDRPAEVVSAIERSPGALRPGVARTLELAGDNARTLAEAILEAPDDDQRAAVAFLVAGMPPMDRTTLSKAYLLENVAYAFKARSATPWAAQVPLELFLNDVLPYSSINEKRDDWRKDFYDRFNAIARAAHTPTEAVAKLNVAVFDAFNVHYHATKRPKPDQSPYESARAGYASCTGLSILLIDACRAVGIPARMVGTARWTTQSGNHTWVEVWDKEWRFVGACEPSKLNEGWFTAQAAAADETKPEHRIYAASFGAVRDHFPLVWRPRVADYPAEDVTRRYTLRRKVTFRLSDGSNPGEITVRHDGRIVAQDHLNPAATFELPGDTSYEVETRRDGQTTPTTRTVELTAEADQVWTLAPL